MKKIALFTGVFVLGAAFSMLTFAGPACCGAKAKVSSASEGDVATKSATCAKSGAADLAKMTEELNLTEEQVAKFSELQKECIAKGATKEACESTMGKFYNELTEEQQEKCKSFCKDKGLGCPVKAAAESEKASDSEG